MISRFARGRCAGTGRAALLWSVAFLHRQRALKLVDAVGVFAPAFPIGAIVVGHLVVGVGAALGISAILAATSATTPRTSASSPSSSAYSACGPMSPPGSCGAGHIAAPSAEPSPARAVQRAPIGRPGATKARGCKRGAWLS